MSMRSAPPIDAHGIESLQDPPPGRRSGAALDLSPGAPPRHLGVTLVAGRGHDRRAARRAVRRPADHRPRAPRQGGPDPGLVTALRPLRPGRRGGHRGRAPTAVNVRLFRASETGLASLRIKAFRHIHDLSMLTQNTERRGSLVCRVTSDVDTICQFVQFGGIILVLSLGAARRRDACSWSIYSPLLDRRRVGSASCRCCSSSASSRASSAGPTRSSASGSATCWPAISESVVGAATIRAYGVEERTAAADRRGHRGPPAARRSARRSASVVAFSSGQLVSGLTLAVVLVVGTLQAVNGHLTLGELLAFLFLVNLFTQPGPAGHRDPQRDAERRRRLAAGDRRHRHARRRGRPGRRRAVELPRGPITVDFDDVSFAYPGGDTVLHDVTSADRPAVPGRHRGRDRLGQVHPGQAADPADGPDRGHGAHRRGRPARRAVLARCANRVVLVPQEGFLFDATLRENVRFGRPEATDEDVRLALTELGLDAWLAGLPAGAGHRGRPARRVAVRRGAAAGGPGPRLPRRPRPAGPRRGDLGGRPLAPRSASSAPSRA